MVVLSVPARLRISALALLISIPLIALEVSLVARAPIWRLPYRNISYWGLTFALITVPLTVWITSGKRWALNLCTALVGTWVLASLWMTFNIGYPELGFFTLMLFLIFSGLLLSIKYEIGRSFFDPKLSWYQGLPKPIPGLKCECFSITSPTDKNKEIVELEVSRIDQDGAFVFCSPKNAKSMAVFPGFLKKRKVRLFFSFRGRQVECQGIPILALDQGTGAGIQFVETAGDLGKDIGDFVELLRGEGYV